LLVAWALPAHGATVNGTVVNVGANVAQDGVTGTGFFIQFREPRFCLEQVLSG
jgi:hypothetical protein